MADEGPQGASTPSAAVQKMRQIKTPTKKEEARTIINAGGLTTILLNMRKYEDDPSVQEEGMRVLVVLAEDFDNRSLSNTHKIYEDAMRALQRYGRHTGLGQLLRHAATTVRWMARNERTNKILTADPWFAHDIMAQVIEANLDNPLVITDASAAITTIATAPKVQRDLVEVHKLHEHLAEALRRYPNDAALQVAALGALWTLVWDPAMRPAICAVGAPDLARQAKATFPDEPKVELYADQLLDSLNEYVDATNLRKFIKGM